MYDSNVSIVDAGYSDVYGFEYTPFDGNDTIILNHVNFTETNYYYPTFPGTAGGGKGDDYIELRGGGEAFNIGGGHGNDIIIIRDNEHFNICNFIDDAGVPRKCGIYGDDEYSKELNVSHFGNYLRSHHGDDNITIYDADIRGIVVNGGHGSDIVKIYTPVQLTGTVLDGGDDAGAADGFVDQIRFEQWIGDINGSQFYDWEQIVLHDASSITFLDDNLTVSHDNGVDTASGLPYGLTIDDNSQLNLYHDFLVDGNLNNHAILNLQDNNTMGSTITISHDYSSDGGQIYMDTSLVGGFLGTLDVLRVEGDTSGTTTLHIDHIAQQGSSASVGADQDVLVVEVGGLSNGQFVLDGKLSVGDYVYYLYKGANGNWYLKTCLCCGWESDRVGFVSWFVVVWMFVLLALVIKNETASA